MGFRRAHRATRDYQLDDALGIAPADATHYRQGQYMRVGLHDRIYRWTGEEWVRANLDSLHDAKVIGGPPPVGEKPWRDVEVEPVKVEVKAEPAQKICIECGKAIEPGTGKSHLIDGQFTYMHRHCAVRVANKAKAARYYG